MNGALYAEQMRHRIPSLYRVSPRPTSVEFVWVDDGWIRVVEGSADVLAGLAQLEAQRRANG